MWKLKNKGRETKLTWTRRYFYQGIQNLTMSWLILVGAPMQREAHARANHYGGPRSLSYTVAATPQTRLVWSHKTLTSLDTILQQLTQEVLWVFSKLTQLTRNNLEQAHKRSN
jgi:hypothetical protein